jgi:type IV pilus assembly protein PilY1
MTKRNIFALVALGTGLVMTGWVLANTVKLSQIPLAKAATQPVAPNLLFILDDSGSMGWEYLPEHVNLENCRARDLYTTPVSCLIGMPPFMSSAFNTLYYDPSIQYVPGVRADGSRFPSMDARATSDWTKVPEDGYRINSNTKNLVSQYPDRQWCAGEDDCVTNQLGYEYPDGKYKGEGKHVGEAVYTSAPYYYNLSPLYCKDDAGTDCQRTKTANY